jgi:putative FmdB family regulatory protein
LPNISESVVGEFLMPIYEYQCEKCDYALEAIQKMSDEPLTDCPECGTDGLRKLVSASAFRLKGSGWYETDFKNDKQKNLAKGEKESTGNGGGIADNANQSPAQSDTKTHQPSKESSPAASRSTPDTSSQS